MILPDMTCGPKYCPTKKQSLHKISAAGIKVLKYIYDKTKKDKMRTKHILEHFVILISYKLRNTHFKMI